MPDDQEAYDLSEGQRLSLLEQSVSLNRKVVIVLVVLTVFGTSALSTLGILSFMEPDQRYAAHLDVEELQAQVVELQAQVLAYENTLAQYQTILDTSSASAFKEILLDQEHSYQTHLSALKQGMRDLSKMLPGSRTWLEMYDEQMDIALDESKARIDQLVSIQTSQLSSKKLKKKSN